MKNIFTSLLITISLSVYPVFSQDLSSNLNNGQTSNILKALFLELSHSNLECDIYSKDMDSDNENNRKSIMNVLGFSLLTTAVVSKDSLTPMITTSSKVNSESEYEVIFDFKLSADSKNIVSIDLFRNIFIQKEINIGTLANPHFILKKELKLVNDGTCILK